MPDVHAKLFGASSSNGWLHCPQFPHMAQIYQDTGSEYAAKGTLAHSIAEFKARSYFLEPITKRAYNAKLKKFAAEELYEPAMAEATDLYLETLKSLALEFGTTPYITFETQVSYTDYAPEGFGTADCIMIGGDRIIVVDYKNGAGVPVEATENSQMKLYALGALQVLRPIYGDTIKRATLVIVQPHAGGVKSWDTTVDELRHWGDMTVKPAVARVLKWDAPCAGDWCRWCRGRATCRARAVHLLGADKYDKTPEIMTAAEISEALQRGEGLVAWYKDLQDYALKASLDGMSIPGFKVVEGRGSRAWKDYTEAFAVLQSRGVAEAMLYERKPITAPALEKLMGAKTFAEVADGLVVKQPGKPTLVPESDKRKPYDPAAAAFKVVE